MHFQMKTSWVRIVAFTVLLLAFSCAVTTALADSSLYISSPSDGDERYLGNSITVKWNEISNAAGYHVTVRNMSTGEYVINREWVTELKKSVSSSSIVSVGPGNYKIWVGAVEERGGESISAWQDYVEISIGLKDSSINQPYDGETYPIGQSITVKWSSVTGAQGYKCHIKRLSGNPDPGNDNEPSLNTWRESTGLTRNFTLDSSKVFGGYWYKFIVEAYADNADSSWSDPCYIFISNKLDKPVISTPANQAEADSGNDLLIKWTSVNGAESYKCHIIRLAGEPDESNENELKLALNDGGEWRVDCGTVRNYTLPANRFIEGYWYKIVVEAIAYGADSGWSDYCYVFSKGMPLTAPVITAPNNWTEVAGGSSVSIKWNSVTGAEGYKCHVIRLKGDPDTSNDSEAKLALNDGGEWRIDRGTNKSYTLSGSNVIGGYWYKIVIEAYASNKSSSWSEWYYVYAKENGSLERPVITSPVAFKNYEPGNSITLSWAGVENATSYKYYIKQLVGEPDYSDNEASSNAWSGTTVASRRYFTLAGSYIEPDTWYKFVVEAKADGYDSGWSRYTYVKIPDREDWIYYVLPENMQNISEECFYDNKLLRTFDASSSKLKTIGSKAFANCTNLKSVNLPASVTEIADDAFANCPSTMTVHCIKGSEAENFAKTHGFPIVEHGVAKETDSIQLSRTYWGASSAYASSTSIKVTSTGSWSASANCNWITISPNSGSGTANVRISVSKNSAGDMRAAMVTFTCGDAQAVLAVSQNYVLINVIPSTGGSESGGGTSSGGTTVTPTVTGHWNDSDTITIQLGDTYSLSGDISVQNGYLGIVSVSVENGDNRALTHDYGGKVTSINLKNESDFVIDTVSNSNFNKAGNYKIAMYAKAYGSTTAVQIGSKKELNIVDQSTPDDLSLKINNINGHTVNFTGTETNTKGYKNRMGINARIGNNFSDTLEFNMTISNVTRIEFSVTDVHGNAAPICVSQYMKDNKNYVPVDKIQDTRAPSNTWWGLKLYFPETVTPGLYVGKVTAYNGNTPNGESVIFTFSVKNTKALYPTGTIKNKIDEIRSKMVGKYWNHATGYTWVTIGDVDSSRKFLTQVSTTAGASTSIGNHYIWKFVSPIPNGYGQETSAGYPNSSNKTNYIDRMGGQCYGFANLVQYYLGSDQHIIGYEADDGSSDRSLTDIEIDAIEKLEPGDYVRTSSYDCKSYHSWIVIGIENGTYYTLDCNRSDPADNLIRDSKTFTVSDLYNDGGRYCFGFVKKNGAKDWNQE